jgi:hypothetical protein
VQRIEMIPDGLCKLELNSARPLKAGLASLSQPRTPAFVLPMHLASRFTLKPRRPVALP